ncbi:MAG TPA: hypothetical protein VIR45_03955 [Kiloniellaceae bacterium]
MVNAAQSGEGFLPDGPAVPRDLLYHKMNGLRAAPPAPNGSAGKPAQSDDWHEDAGVSRKRRWSEADDERLRRLWHSNHSLEEIAEAMGRTTPSLYSRARALGMSKRSPATGERAEAAPATNGAQSADAAATKAAPASEDDMPGGSKRQAEPPSAKPRTTIEVKRHQLPRRSIGEGPASAGGFGGGQSGRSGATADSMLDEAVDAGVDPIIHFLRSRDYSVVRVEDGRFKLDGRRVLSAEELREKANQVRLSMGKPPFAPHPLGQAG